ncbi:SET family sugar efflux transporter-like MFS transporter [Kribbella voronezhensis]|uniref:SET family sugar efflux transporter-like MFS transporter n=2 Tax=Kribbella voronezhensis TaxID=2512212 RepID=A0A4R7ST18_9ACTN|nr:SET family sugar efflux transporter-like MFS transporter [Kribbella voronezhensis]
MSRAVVGPMLAAVVLLGLADSMAGTYLVLFAVEEARFAPLQVGVFVSAVALGGIVASMIFGRRFDRAPTRRWLVVSVLAGAGGYALLSVITGFPSLLLVGLVLLGAVGAGYPQLFALADVAFAVNAKKRVAPLLRSGWSLAWAVGPLLGAWLVSAAGYDIVFQASAVALILTTSTVLLIPRPSGGTRPAPPTAERRNPRSRGFIAILTASIALVHTAMFTGSVALPLFVTGDLRRSGSDVGLLFSACAVVEVLAAFVLVWLLPRVNRPRLIMVGLGLFAIYFLVAALAGSLLVLLIAQVARGVAIAVIGTAGIQHFQVVMKPAGGAAAALFSNAVTAGSLVSGVLAGLLVQAFGTTATLGWCAGMSVAAAAAFWLAHRWRPEGVDIDSTV